MNNSAIETKNLHKSYRMGTVDLHVLRGVSFQIPAGQLTAVVGASGSGKSTLLHLVGLLDRQDEGTVSLDGRDTAGLSAGKRNRIRCTDVGFVFQFYHLLPELSVLENVLLPAMVDLSTARWAAGKNKKVKHAAELLDRFGLSKRLKHKPRELSGGERQRTAIARALVNQPKILLADEPTGNLDSVTGKKIMDVLKEFNQQFNQTMLMVTHDLQIAEQADRILHLKDGKLAD